MIMKKNILQLLPVHPMLDMQKNMKNKKRKKKTTTKTLSLFCREFNQNFKL